MGEDHFKGSSGQDGSRFTAVQYDSELVLNRLKSTPIFFTRDLIRYQVKILDTEVNHEFGAQFFWIVTFLLITMVLLFILDLVQMISHMCSCCGETLHIYWIHTQQ
jgi:hypothetical protein